MISKDPLVDKTVGHLFRHEAGKMAAVLTRMLGSNHLDDIEDIVQDTLLKALDVWKYKGIPQNPTAWLYTVARNRAIDRLRSTKKIQKLESIEESVVDRASEYDDLEKIVEDSQLRMMFACCHRAIPEESQIAFILKTLGGLTVKEIASAFVSSEETIAKRIYRAKEKLKELNIELVSPPIYELPSRLESVLKVLYLLFNEGYYSSNPQYVIREDLCVEAMRLTYLLIRYKATAFPKVKALLALMCLHASRFTARTDDQNQIVLLEHQDRSQWNQELIQRGLSWLEDSADGDNLSEYHVEAAIASVHVLAKSFQETNWDALVRLYETLDLVKPGKFTRLNPAIAVGYRDSAKAGIEALLCLNEITDSHYYNAALGNFYFMDNDFNAAQKYFERAISITQSASEKRMLIEKLKSATRN